MKPNSNAANRKQLRLDAIKEICDTWDRPFPPTYDSIAVALNERHITTAHGLQWTGLLAYQELKRVDARIEDLIDVLPTSGRPIAISKKSSLKQEGIFKVKRAIKQFLMSWKHGNKPLPKFTEIALHLNCLFIQICDDDEPWNADSTHHFMETHDLDRKDFVPISGEEVGCVLP